MLDPILSSTELFLKNGPQPRRSDGWPWRGGRWSHHPDTEFTRRRWG